MLNPVIKSLIRIRFKDPEEASIVARALKPDDKPLPEGLQVETKHSGNEVVVEIVCHRGFTSFLATVDDVLKMASVSEKILTDNRPKHTDI
ncbi:MAG: KEOPS complex subunit Pcc1 [Candidatus Caldarchaeum sp.]|nr:KEOPS complex subunit Pcc1 [Candidatus Caldarchaeum sp.]MCS7133428.1 KEOPS complex subunit Pcc1 [Candidatus Caldarchaeum sp.]MCX8202001.1 KEOPS complex subunit Pcc1 [Candidatus Caldarchaeum sp.]MDW8062783.1 KEOPS complex subunit Pcc1 [Candidatus Caldarchaeum sp.]MDW8435043.1 KEOPS complex subunit Pcc1 [Candidatus Caldarchaeum sp.]